MFGLICVGSLALATNPMQCRFFDTYHRESAVSTSHVGVFSEMGIWSSDQERECEKKERYEMKFVNETYRLGTNLNVHSTKLQKNCSSPCKFLEVFNLRQAELA